MKKLFVLTAIAGLFLTTACNNATKPDTKATETAKPKGKYYCTMHPEITSEKPGTCSKCGMDLAERDTKEK